MVACPAKCGGMVEWHFVTLPGGGRLPARPGACDACTLPGREEALRAAEAARVAAQEGAEAVEGAQHWQRVADRAASILDVLRSAGVNTREHGHVTLDTFDFSECGPVVEQECRRFVADAKRAGPHDAVVGLYLKGTTGNGKTQLLAAIARELLLDPDWQPEDVVFDVAVDLLDEIQDAYSNGGAKAAKQRRIGARVWLLDDLGTERPKEDPARVLYQIVNARALAPTAIASNLKPDEIEQRNPELARVVSRLGPAYFRGVGVQGKDRRYRKAG